MSKRRKASKRPASTEVPRDDSLVSASSQSDIPAENFDANGALNQLALEPEETEVENALGWLGALGVEPGSETEREIALGLLEFYADLDYLNDPRIRFTYCPIQSTSSMITAILDDAFECEKAESCAQHLVGASLEMRLPKLAIPNSAARTADTATENSSEFQVGDTVFHVALVPYASVFENCRSNLAEGKSPFVLVPAKKLFAAQGMAEMYLTIPIAIESIESFVASHIDSQGGFSRSGVKLHLRQFVETYNRRVDAVETDKSLLIKPPEDLLAARSI